MSRAPAYNLAQINLARMPRPLDYPAMASFVARFEAGTPPTTAQAKERIGHPRRRGPGPYAVIFKARFPAPACESLMTEA